MLSGGIRNRIAPDEERLVLSKPIVQFSFTYGMSRGSFALLSSHLRRTLIIAFIRKCCQDRLKKVKHLTYRDYGNPPPPKKIPKRILMPIFELLD